MRLKLITFLVVACLHVQAQVPFGNEWIRKDQKYLKIKVSENGIYQISYNQLQSANFAPDDINPKHFKLFFQGQEVPLYVDGEDDNIFNPTDFILFFGKKNDGKKDEILYDSPTMQPNPEVSLFSDESTYFLTVSTDPGKRYTSPQLNAASLNPEPFLIYTASQNHFSQYFPGKYILDVMSLSEYTDGEGYVGSPFEKGASQTNVLNTPGKVNTLLFNPYLDFYVTGRSDATSTSPFNHHLRVSVNGAIIKDTLYRGYNNIKSRIALNYSNLQDATSVIFSSINDLGALTDYQSLAYVRLTYARNFDASQYNSLSFKLKSSESNLLLRFNNSSWRNPLLVDTTNARLYRGIENDGKTQFVVVNPGDATLFLSDQSAIKNVSIEPVTFSLVDPTTFSFNLLIVTHQSLFESANEYAAYKISKGFSPFIITTEEVYNQFYYGLHHPQAIRNLARLLLAKAQKKPEYLLLLGKGLETPKFALAQDLVPTMSYPASDAAFTSQILDNNLAPAIATGRIPALTNEQVRDYLDKVKSYENLSNAHYRKTFLHITGGKDINENRTFVTYLTNLGKIAEKPHLGAAILNFNKNVSDPVTDNLTDKIQKAISDGAGFLSFLGHGSTTATEVSLGNPSNYNGDKNLFFLANGCSTGNAFTSGSLGEQYLFFKNRGAIGWIGTSSEGVGSYLYNYTQLLYSNLLKNNYGKSIAQNMLITTREYQNPSDNLNKAHTKQYIYLGDPTIALYSPEKPDYEIRPQDIFINTTNLSANTKSIKLGIIVRNNGRATNDNLLVSIKRKLANNSVIDYPVKSFLPIYNTDTLYYDIDNDIQNTAGSNTFTVSLDPQNNLQELNELNNSATLMYFIPSDGLTIISPAEFSIVPSPNVDLKIQNNNLLAKASQYLFEIDTLNTFNSSWIKKSEIITADLFATWQPSVPLEPNKVYYWRARLNKDVNDGGGWQTSSFTYIPNSAHGWNQAHYQQWGQVTLDKIERSNSGQTFKYSNTTFPILIRTRGDQAETSTERAIRFSISAGKASFNTSEFSGISIAALHPFKQGLLFNYPSSFNYKNDGVNGTGQYYFNPSIPLEADSLVRFITNIPDGYFVVGMSGINFSPKDFPESVNASFRTLGLTTFTTVGIGEPYAFWGQKGAAPGSALEKTADYADNVPARQQNFDFSYNLPYPYNTGYYLSEAIGPAVNWGKVSFNLTGDDSDQISFGIIGIKSDGSELTLVDNISGPELDISTIAASTYPYIKLKALVADNINFTVSQLKDWKVIYDPFNDITINPQFANEFHAYHIQQGDSLKLKLGISNIEGLKSDSIKVRYNIIKNDRTQIGSYLNTLPPLDVNQSDIINFSYSTVSLVDSNLLQIFIEPKSLQDKISYNNQISYPFYVQADRKAPIVDILFDGQRIVNGETVSPKPQITISVTDENNFLLLNDTSSVEVHLLNENTNINKRISFSSQQLSLQSSGEPGRNKANYIFNPEVLEDAVYTLKVRSKDKLGNYVTSNDYEISFEVINEESISNFLPYPNPFTTSMRFVFKVTGQKVPDKIKVQIMTATGKIVREILKEELGNIRIGNNISDFKWDGTDAFGDRLANGVYFYRVLIENNDKSEIKHKALAADSMFKKSFGKIYLMR